MTLTDTFSLYRPNGSVGCASFEQVFGRVGEESFCDAVTLDGCTYWRNGLLGAMWYDLVHSSDFAFRYQRHIWDTFMSEYDEWVRGLSEDELSDVDFDLDGPDSLMVEAEWLRLMDDPSWITPSLVL